MRGTGTWRRAGGRGGDPAGAIRRTAGGRGFDARPWEMDQRESWRSLLESLADDGPLAGVAHFLALDGHGEGATTEEMADDVARAGASALAMAQGLADSGGAPEKGLWFVTRGAQVLERERGGELSGAALWGFGKGVAREAPHLQPRMIDLDPGRMAPAPDLANELLYPDPENHIAYRLGRRRVARVVRAEAGGERLVLPEDSNWVLAPDPDGVFDRPHVQSLAARPLEPNEVRVAVEAAGLNFWDVFRSLGFIEEGCSAGRCAVTWWTWAPRSPASRSATTWWAWGSAPSDRRWSRTGSWWPRPRTDSP